MKRPPLPEYKPTPDPQTDVQISAHWMIAKIRFPCAMIKKRGKSDRCATAATHHPFRPPSGPPPPAGGRTGGAGAGGGVGQGDAAVPEALGGARRDGPEGEGDRPQHGSRPRAPAPIGRTHPPPLTHTEGDDVPGEADTRGRWI